MTRASSTPSRSRKALTWNKARERVLKKFPKAACIEVSGCTLAVFSCGVIDTTTLLALGHTKREAWIEAERKL